jgi:hypothetical protein
METLSKKMHGDCLAILSSEIQYFTKFHQQGRLSYSQVNTVRLRLKPGKINVVPERKDQECNSKNSHLSHLLWNQGWYSKTNETAIPTAAIEQAIGDTDSYQKRKRALPSHLVVCLIIAMSLWSKAASNKFITN